MRRIVIGVAFVLLAGVLQAQQVSPQRSTSNQNRANNVTAAAGENSVSLVDDFGQTWVLTRQGDGTYYQGVVSGIGLWVVTGRLTSNSFELHGVNPNVDNPPGFCGSFVWNGTRSGTTLTGTLFQEATAFNISVGCTLNVASNGTVTVLIP